MCKIYKLLILVYHILSTSHILSLNLVSNKRNTSNKSIYNQDDSLKFPSTLKFVLNNINSLPTNEDNLFSNLDLIHKKEESDKKLQEINETIKDGVLIDPRTNEKLFQNESEETENEVEVKEPSLGTSGGNYKEGVDSTAEELNDISNKMTSDGQNNEETDEIQLRENLLNKIMKSQQPENFGA